MLYHAFIRRRLVIYPESITFVVKTNYSISKAAQSSGTELTVSITGASFVDISLSGDKIIDLIKDEVFTDPGVTVLNNLVNVTSDASITKVITQDDIEVGSVDTSTTGTYKIEYTTTYNDTTEVLTRTVHITE